VVVVDRQMLLAVRMVVGDPEREPVIRVCPVGRRTEDEQVSASFDKPPDPGG